MGFDPEFINQLAARIAQLEAQVAQLRSQNAPRSAIVDAGVIAEADTSNVIGSAIESAYSQVNNELAILKQQDITPAINAQINNLIALKAQIPYHFSVSQGDQEWLNERINAILGTNSSA